MRSILTRLDDRPLFFSVEWQLYKRFGPVMPRFEAWFRLRTARARKCVNGQKRMKRIKTRRKQAQDFSVLGNETTE